MVTTTTSVREILSQFEEGDGLDQMSGETSLNRNATSLERWATERRHSRQRSGGSSPRGPRRRLRKAMGM